jgi:hypothetical protein
MALSARMPELSAFLRTIAIPDLDLRRDLRAIWVGGRIPPAGAVRDVLSHISRVR